MALDDPNFDPKPSLLAGQTNGSSEYAYGSCVVGEVSLFVDSGIGSLSLYERIDQPEAQHKHCQRYFSDGTKGRPHSPGI